MRTLIAIFILIAGFSTSWAAQAGKRVALVIGNATYANAPKLLNPKNDAKAIATALTRLGFDVTELHDLRGQAMRDAFAAFEDKATGADWALVYYAGHGMELNGKNWLVPVDAKLAKASDAPDETISLDRVLARVRTAKTLRIVLLDACRNNPFLAKMDMGRGATRAVDRGLARVEPEHGEVVFYAARDGSTAADGEGVNSPFAAAILAHIEEPGLELDRFFRRVTSTVMKATAPDRQEPYTYGRLPDADFYFLPPLPPGFVLAPRQPQQQASLPRPQPKALVTAVNPLVAGGYEDKAKRLIRSLNGHDGSVSSSNFSPDGMNIVTAGLDKIVKVWDALTGKLKFKINAHNEEVRIASFSADGLYLLSASDDKTIKLWNSKTGQILRVFSGHTDAVKAAIFSPDSKTIISGGWDENIKVWDVATGSLKHTWKSQGGYIWSLSFSPTGKFVASGNHDNTVTIWDISTKSVVRVLRGHSNMVWGVAFSPDGTKVASGSPDMSIKVWDIKSGQLINQLVGHEYWVTSVSFSSDSSKIVSTSIDGITKIWDWNASRALLSIKAHFHSGISSSLSSDSQVLVTGGCDVSDSVKGCAKGSGKLWDVSEWTQSKEARQ